MLLPDYDMLDEVNNACIKIPLLQAINEIPIFTKQIRDLSIKKPRRKRKEIKRIQIFGKIVDIMVGKITIQKYIDPGSLIVKTHINGIEIPNTLIDIGAIINIMSKQTLNQLELSNLQYTLTLL